jgi:hypothetical protein
MATMTAGPLPAPRRRLSRGRRLLFAFVPLFTILLIAEIAIRFGRAPTHFGSFRELRTDLLRRNYPAEKHPTLGYVPKANYESRDNHWGTLVSIDADGMRRNGAKALAPAPGAKVIAAVGDSFTFGDEVDDDASWPAQLEVALGQPVKNGGVFGYSFAQAVLRAEWMLERFPVEALVVSFVPDDLTRCEYEKRYTKVPWFDLGAGSDGDGLVLRGVPIDHDAVSADDATKRWKDFFGRSALVDAVLANVARAWWFENEKQVTVPHLKGRGGELGQCLVDRIAARCRTANVRLLVLLQGEAPRDDALAVLAHAQQRGVATLDLASEFAALHAEDASLRTRWFRGHMTREGNGWVAERVAAALRSGR